MDCFSICLGDNAKVLTKFFDKCPVTNSTILLDLLPHWMSQHKLNPFHLKVGAAFHHTGFKIFR